MEVKFNREQNESTIQSIDFTIPILSLEDRISRKTFEEVETEKPQFTEGSLEEKNNRKRIRAKRNLITLKGVTRRVLKLLKNSNEQKTTNKIISQIDQQWSQNIKNLRKKLNSTLEILIEMNILNKTQPNSYFYPPKTPQHIQKAIRRQKRVFSRSEKKLKMIKAILDKKTVIKKGHLKKLQKIELDNTTDISYIRLIPRNIIQKMQQQKKRDKKNQSIEMLLGEKPQQPIDLLNMHYIDQ